LRRVKNRILVSNRKPDLIIHERKVDENQIPTPSDSIFADTLSRACLPPAAQPVLQSSSLIRWSTAHYSYRHNQINKRFPIVKWFPSGLRLRILISL
jgi:hypothetical protein